MREALQQLAPPTVAPALLVALVVPARVTLRLAVAVVNPRARQVSATSVRQVRAASVAPAELGPLAAMAAKVGTPGPPAPQPLRLVVAAAALAPWEPTVSGVQVEEAR